MRRRLMIGVLSGGLMAAMLPGVTTADQPIEVLTCNKQSSIFKAKHKLALTVGKISGQADPQDDATVGGVVGDGSGPGAGISACHNPND